ncbi:hypothetical protein [Nocardia sp. NPDC004260]
MTRPDESEGKGDLTGNGGSQENISKTPTPPYDTTIHPLPEGSGLILHPDHMPGPIAAVDLVDEIFTTVNKRLARSNGDAFFVMMDPGIFGDTAIASAWSAFHQAWVREIGVTSSAIAELRKLLPDATAKYKVADLDGRRMIADV